MARTTRILFPKVKRTDSRKKLWSEGNYQFLQRSPHIETARQRKVVEEWFSHLQIGRADFLGRFQSKDLGNFESAFFELYLHELLVRLAYSVTPHPNTEEGNPDFLIQGEDRNEFYLEAIAPIGVPKGKHQAYSRRNEVLDRIAKLVSPDFFLDIHSQGRLSKSYSVSELKRELKRLEKWVADLCYDSVVTQIEEKKRPPSFTLCVDGLTLHIDPLPKRRFRGSPGISTLGTFSFGEAVSDDNPLLTAILAKANKYKRLSKPYLVAVNYLDWPLDRSIILDTFLGKGELRYFDDDDPEAQPAISRPYPGLWRDDRYTTVSGVILGVGIEPSKIADRDLTLFLNPYAGYPYKGRLEELPQGIVSNYSRDTMEWQPGVHTRSILGLPKGWPLRRPVKKRSK
jgi:hypothetical protein